MDVCPAFFHFSLSASSVSQSFNGGKTKKDTTFSCIQLLNELSKKIPVAQALKIFKFATKPEKPRLSISIHLEVRIKQT